MSVSNNSLCLISDYCSYAIDYTLFPDEKLKIKVYELY